MTLPIKVTPDLRGKESESFYESMESRKIVPKCDYDRAEKTYRQMTKESPRKK